MLNNRAPSYPSQPAPKIPGIDLHRVTHDIAAKRLLDDVSLTISPGEYVALMGHNGSGKTTLIRHFNGLLLPTSGEVRVDGMPTTDPHALPEIRKKVGMVFQDPDDQMVTVTVEDEIAFGLENRAVPYETMVSSVAETMEMFRLTELRSRSTSSLSGGEQQRVAIAASWVTDPDTLVLDEPTSMLDMIAAEELLAHLDEIRGAKAIVHVTQSLKEARRAERLIVLGRSKIVYDGPSAIVDEKPHMPREWGLSRSPSTRIPTRRPVTDPAIETQNVVFIRDDGRDKRTILRNLTFRGDNGRIVAVVGRSGSGKTTLAFHLNRLLEPAAGKVLIAERDATDMPIHEVRRTVGMTFQRVDLQLFGATVIEDVAFGLIQRDIPEREARDRSIAAMRQVGIDPELFAERSPSTLSTGEKRRAALAGVLVMDPAVIVFDEPTSGLDAAGVDSLEDTLSALRTAGKALIVITHDLDFARDIADSVLVMDAGSGVQTENIEAISEVAPV